jgi:cyclopropane fatty-acyl-phospholipid synthase-like methyltransferase
MESVTPENFRPKDYWIVENQQYAVPSFRLRKCARMLNEMARGRTCSLLDVGCGPGALRSLLDSNFDYRGIDIAIQSPAPFLKEVDFAKSPISYDGRRFDFVVGMGILEYMGKLQREKFSQIKDILNDDGKFVMTYINFGHMQGLVWPNYNNVQSIAAMTESLSEQFTVEKRFPASHHRRQKQPGRYSVPSLQMHINFNIPILSPMFAVEYFFVCSKKK